MMPSPHRRTARFDIEVPHGWLTADGDVTEEAGWTYLEEALRESTTWPLSANGPKMSFIELEDDDDQV